METTAQVHARLSALPRAALGFFPTPFHRAENLSRELGVDLWLKRDDLTGMSLFGGNKVRKLEYVLGEARARGCDTVVSYGATQSNCAMQVATACRRLGMRPILYLVAIVEPAELRANLLLDYVLDAEVHLVPLNGGTEEEAEEEAVRLGRAHMARLEGEGHICCEVPMGAAQPLGSAGFIGGWAELLVQCRGQGYPARTAALGTRALRAIGSDETLRPEDFRTDLGYYGAGYEAPAPAATAAIRRLARTEGILVDPVYTGKALSGLIDYAEQGKIPRGSTVVFWHTGGATALFAEPEMVGPVADGRAL